MRIILINLIMRNEVFAVDVAVPLAETQTSRVFSTCWSGNWLEWVFSSYRI